MHSWAHLMELEEERQTHEDRHVSATYVSTKQQMPVPAGRRHAMGALHTRSPVGSPETQIQVQRQPASSGPSSSFG